MNLSTLIKLPSRNRPALFLQRLGEYLADDSVRVLVTLDSDDPKLPEYLAGLERIDTSRVKVRVGDSKSKVLAINDGVAEEDWRLCILASDDFKPMRPDYARHIANIFDAFWPDGDGVLHLNDGRVGRTLNTLPILDRRYFQRDGYIYRPAMAPDDADGYWSLWSDNEFQDVSEARNRAAYCDEVVIRHEWIGEAAPDDLHRRNEAFYQRDMETYLARKSRGFPA